MKTYSFEEQEEITLRGWNQNLSKLRGLPASSLAHHNNALPPPEGLDELLFDLVYRQGSPLDLNLCPVRRRACATHTNFIFGATFPFQVRTSTHN